MDFNALSAALARHCPQGLSAGQRAGIAAIVAGWARLSPLADDRQLAYVLATAGHETAMRFQPVRETLAASDAEAIRRLDRAFAAGRLPQVRKPYWRADAAGRAYFGRGLVQITHRENYRRLGAVLGVDLVAEPDRALDPDHAVAILIIGMRDGLFSGERLADHFGPGRADWLGARAIVNGTDRARDVASLARAFLAGLSAARAQSTKEHR